MAYQTATNPSTGEKIVLIGDQWSPYTQSATNAQGTKAFLVNNQWLTEDAPAAPAQTEIPAARRPSSLENFATQAWNAVASTPANAYGLLEVPTTMLTGAVGHLVGTPIGIASTFGEGFGTPQAAELAQQRAAKIAGAMTYEPRTQAGKTLTQVIAKPFEGMPPYLGGNMAAVTSTLGPAAAQQTFQAAQKARAPSAAKVARMTAEDYARGPQIDAAADAQRMGILLRPTDIQPTPGPRVTEAVAGAKGGEKVVAANKTQVRKIQLNDMGMPETAPLNTVDTFDAARKKVSKPYDEVAKLPVQQADDAMVQRLEALRPDLAIIGAEDYAPTISKIVDSAIDRTQSGLTGQQLLDNISTLRDRAKRTYANKAADDKALDIADTNLKVASELESMIENSITNPKLLSQFRDARQKMARIYAYEGATDLNTGVLDVKKLSRITAKNNNLTGDIGALGRIAGNFPHAFEVKPKGSWLKQGAVELGRSTPPGALGGLAGFELTGNYEGAIIGSLAGALAGKGAQNYMANRLASPVYQAALKLRDLRGPQLTPAEINYTSNMLVPYQQEVLGPSGESAANRLRVIGYDENGVPIYAADPRGQGFTMPPQPYFGAAPTPYAQRSLPNEVPQQKARQLYESQKRADLAQGFRESDERLPASGEILFDFDPITGRLVPAQPQGTALPQMSALESAVQKMSGQMVFEPKTQYETVQTGSYLNRAPMYETRPTEMLTLTPAEAKKYALPTRQGQAFAMTAEEKIAWNKAKADLAEVMPGMKALSDEAIAAKMMDRDWTAKAVQNARTKAEQLAKQEAALAEQLANRDNLRLMAREIDAKNKELARIQAERQSLMDLAEQMDETLRAPRPVSTGGQGPKTRAFQRNKLNMLSDQEALNKLLEK